MTQTLDGRAAIVTGAGHGIGAEIAVRLAADGARVAVNDIDTDAARTVASRIGGIAIPGDITDGDTVTRIIDDTGWEFGRLDILVNNAGIEHRAAFADHSIAAWDRVLAVNLTAPFILARQALPLLSQHRGAIVNICSVAVVGFAGQAAYDASKGGLATLTRSMAVEFGRHHVRANAVCPGFIDTDMVRKAGLSSYADAQVQALPIQRMGSAEEVAAAVAWLASSESSYVTGQCLHVDGGWVRT